MPVMPRRAIPWVCVLAVIVVAVAGFGGEAAGQVSGVFRGPLVLDGLPPLTMTVVLQPPEPALYQIDHLGRIVDTGILVATTKSEVGFFVSVFGYLQSSRPCCKQQCFFWGTGVNGRFDLVLGAESCGAAGSLTLRPID